jgi:hypothetical protein
MPPLGLFESLLVDISIQEHRECGLAEQPCTATDATPNPRSLHQGPKRRFGSSGNGGRIFQTSGLSRMMSGFNLSGRGCFIWRIWAQQFSPQL